MRPPPGVAGAQLCQAGDRNPGLQLVQKMRPGIRKADRIAGIDRQNRRQGRIEDAEPHRFLVRIDDMDAAAATRRRCGRIAGARRLGELAEPRPDGRQRAHKAARTQQLAPCPAARAQETVQPPLLHLVHVQEPIRGPSIERAVLDVLADYPGALFVSAAEQTAAIVAMRRRVAFALMIMPMRHGNSLYPSPPIPFRGSSQKACRPANGHSWGYNSRLYQESSSPNLQRICSKSLLGVVMPPAILAASPESTASLPRDIGAALAPASFGESSLVIAIPSVESVAQGSLSSAVSMRREVGNITIIVSLGGGDCSLSGGNRTLGTEGALTRLPQTAIRGVGTLSRNAREGRHGAYLKAPLPHCGRGRTQPAGLGG